MKNKIAASLLFVLLFCSISYSQFLTGFGVKGGATLSNQNYDYKNIDFEPETKFILGYNAAVFVEFLNNRNLNLLLDAGFEQRGYTYVAKPFDEFGNPLPDMDVYFRTYYLTGGLLMKLKAPLGSITPYLLIGPKLDIFLDYSQKSEDENNTFVGFDKPIEQFKDVNYSLNLGAGMEFLKLLPFKTFIEFSYSPPANSSYNGPGLIVKEYYFNAKLGINFMKVKTKKKVK